MDYQAPKNPRHKGVLKREQMWWVDDAWDGATLDWLTRFTEGVGYRFDLAYLCEALAADGATVHLPGLVPSADWLTKYFVHLHDSDGDFRKFHFGTKARQNQDRPEVFATWEEHETLSEPVRFYIFLTSFGHGGRDNHQMSKLLLSTAAFTEEDIAFLVDYRTELFGWALPSVLRNPGFASNPEYVTALEAFLETRRTERRDPRIDTGNLGLIVDNWNLPTGALELLVAELEDELGLAEAWSHEPNEECCPEGTFDQRLRNYREKVKFTGGSYLANSVPQYAHLFSRIEYHPNWGGEDFSFRLAGDLPWGRTYFTLLPTLLAGEARRELESGDRTILGDSSWVHEHIYREEPYDLLRTGAEALLAHPDLATANDFALYLPAVGAILKERREALGVEEGVIPHEWVNLLFS